MKKKNLFFPLVILTLLIGLQGCNLEQDIDVDLPPFVSELVTECYLEKNEPYRLLLTESTGYFESAVAPFITEALVVIEKGGIKDTLEFVGLKQDPNTKKFYNFALKVPVVFDVNEPYFLTIKDGKGRVITGTTRFQPVVPIDTVEVNYNEANKAYLLLRFTENVNTANFYRFTVTGDSAINELDTGFTFRDITFEDKNAAVGTANDFVAGDSVVVRLYHIEEKYYNWLRTVDDAVAANLNPFSQPANVLSTVEGGIGVFTALSVDADTLKLE